VLQPEALVDQLQVGRHRVHEPAPRTVRCTLDPETGTRNVCDDNTTTNQPTSSSPTVAQATPQITTQGVAQHRTAVSISSNQDNGGYGSSFVWSPDSRWLFVDDAKGRLLVLDSHTGHAVDLGVNLLPLSQLALRSTSR
jgi:hypothetical protein